MEAAVLVLDNDYRRVRVEPWQKAFSDLVRGKTEAVSYSRDGAVQIVRSVSQEFQLPSIVRLLRRYARSKMQVKFSRENIFARDDGRCQYCGHDIRYTEDMTYDHVVPRQQGGKTCWENIVACCDKCNGRKANRTPAQAGMTLIRKPVRPKYLQIPEIKVRMNRRDIPEEWWPYWSVTLDP